MESNSGSDRDEDEDENKSKRGPTMMKNTNHKGKLVISYNNKGVPIGKEATKLSTFEGKAARTMVPITYATWPDVDENTKEELWQYVLAHFEVDPKSRTQTLQSIGDKWKNFKHTLYRDHIETQKDDPEEKKNLLNPPKKYPFLRKEDWKLFVAQRLTKEWQDRSKKGKRLRAHNKYNHHLSRKGYANLLVEMMQETGKTEEEIDRATLWKKARVLKTGGFQKDVRVIVDRIDELHRSEASGNVICGTNDVLAQALGTTEPRGHVRGMGKFVTQHQYFYLPKTVKHYLDDEKKKNDQRFNKLEDDLEKLKKGMTNVSEAGSCQMWGNEDYEDDPLEDRLDNSCLLAVDFPSNIVAKGTILMDTCEGGETAKVMMEVALQGETLLPIPLEEEYIEKVKEAVGHILSWPRHLVIRCSEMVISFMKK
ncbi:hypothetical protein HanHA300_Chr04g0126701 [Helianthus annuus]|nr:hypothetical protein HanHA300_Chr04g0126701 [Helianthus annuus]KAJ0596163.1 hypothetical protein HanHA89_Chr04g0139611 [Helianthus annuus]KAJ0756814.1 hypothetical protein HanLR1_Chr04g0131351 [Helianthus annuus]KAJ0760557.1 hypothetical protein HanOQP8_Chr04g0139321 [Helianthus annuus]